MFVVCCLIVHPTIGETGKRPSLVRQGSEGGYKWSEEGEMKRLWFAEQIATRPCTVCCIVFVIVILITVASASVFEFLIEDTDQVCLFVYFLVYFLVHRVLMNERSLTIMDEI